MIFFSRWKRPILGDAIRDFKNHWKNYEIVKLGKTQIASHFSMSLSHAEMRYNLPLIERVFVCVKLWGIVRNCGGLFGRVYAIGERVPESAFSIYYRSTHKGNFSLSSRDD